MSLLQVEFTHVFLLLRFLPSLHVFDFKHAKCLNGTVIQIQNTHEHRSDESLCEVKVVFDQRCVDKKMFEDTKGVIRIRI